MTIGRSSTNFQLRGILFVASRPRQNALNSSREIAPMKRKAQIVVQEADHTVAVAEGAPANLPR